MRENAAYVELLVLRAEPLPLGPLHASVRDVGRASLWAPIELGRNEFGGIVSLSLPEHNLLIGGEPGAGKSVVMSLIVSMAALDPSVTLTLLDGKQVELSSWEQCAARFVGPDQNDALVALEAIREDMERRYELLREVKRRKVESDMNLGLHVVVVDELAFYLRGGKKEIRDQIAEVLRDLVSRGRAAGIIVIAATQKPGHEIVPTWIRDLFSYRLALRCTSPEASDTILGQGWASRGFSAATIDPANRGVGLLLAEGGKPIKFKASFSLTKTSTKSRFEPSF